MVRRPIPRTRAPGGAITTAIPICPARRLSGAMIRPFTLTGARADREGALGGDDFSVRWTRQASFPGGRYLFKVNSDDGVRLWLDWVAIIDEWHDKLGQVTYSRELDVSNGNHTVVVEYYEHGGLASVQVEWQPTNVNWLGNLYTCMALQDSWIKVYRLAPNNRWEDLNPDGYALNSADGGHAIFGLPVDAAYGWDGQPYRVELWVKGRMVPRKATSLPASRRSGSCPARTCARPGPAGPRSRRSRCCRTSPERLRRHPSRKRLCAVMVVPV